MIHFAGLKSVSESINDPIKYYKNNVVGSLTLVSEMVKHKVTNIIFSSSATVYGQPEIIPLTEDCKTEKPTNPYGYSKLVVENILRDLVKSSHDFNVTCLRYFNPVGAHPSGEIGENPNGVPSNIMPYISGVAIGKYKQLNIYGSDYNTPDGTGIRDYIHVMDLAEGHLCALRKKWSTPSFRIYNLGTGKGYSVLELVNTFEQVSGIKIACNYSERRCGDIGECWSNPKAAERDLGWKAKYDIQKMVFDTWNWQQKNPTGYV